jgi:hypothetical protein
MTNMRITIILMEMGTTTSLPSTGMSGTDIRALLPHAKAIMLNGMWMAAVTCGQYPWPLRKQERVYGY